MIDNLIKILQGQSVVVDASDPEVASKARATHKTITTRKDRYKDPRTDDEILRDSFHGTIREVGIAKLTQGVINEQTPVWGDRSTYGWDIDTCNLKLEIKPQHGVFFSVSDIVAQRMINNSDHYDYIVTVKIIKMDEGISMYKVIPCQLIKSKDFARKCTKSMYKNNQMYYNHKYNPVIKLNDWSE